MAKRYVGGIEGGGTKFRCAVSEYDAELGETVKVLESSVDQTVITTGTPAETLSQIVAFFSPYRLEHLGIGCFGPLNLQRQSGRYGEILDTPKLAWQGVNLVRELGILSPSLCIQTDVVVAAMAEDAARDDGLQSLAYVTVGTGIGVGILNRGRPLHGNGHAEAGHILPRRHPQDDFAGCCPFHRDCLEGLASGPAIEQRWSCPPAKLGILQAWEFEAYYLAQLCLSLIRTINPHRIVLGGGVLAHDGLMTQIRNQVMHLCAGYYAYDRDALEQIIQPAQLGPDAGLLGALLLGVNGSS